MNMGDPVPRLRQDLEVSPTSYQGEKAVVVRDYLGLIRDPVILQGDALDIVSLIDGARTIRDIQLELVRRKNGVLVETEAVARLVRQLDSAFLLESGRYISEKERALADYLKLETRAAAHAGVSYPAAADELGAYLDSILGSAGDGESAGSPDGLCGLIAPHIDLEVGKRVYAAAYRAIRSARPGRIWLIGTGHSLDNAYFGLTEKDFETPLGLAKTDRTAVRTLKKAGGKAVSSYDISHSREHSLEFQLIFLQRLFGSSFTIIPILCGSFGRDLARVSGPSEIPDVARFLAALRALWEAGPADTLFIAAVDFSHIGPKFGHDRPARLIAGQSEAHDRRLLDAITVLRADQFWEESIRVQDQYHVCGFSALACMLEILPPCQGRILDYQLWHEGPTQSAVSFAAAVFTSSGGK